MMCCYNPISSQTRRGNCNSNRRWWNQRIVIPSSQSISECSIGVTDCWFRKRGFIHSRRLSTLIVVPGSLSGVIETIRSPPSYSSLLRIFLLVSIRFHSVWFYSACLARGKRKTSTEPWKDVGMVCLIVCRGDTVPDKEVWQH